MGTNNKKLKPKVTILPAIEKTHRNEKKSDGSKKRVGAYVRVSTFGEQVSSYDLQINYFKEFIRKNPNWKLVKIYSDEGITGTSIKNREGFKQMIKDAESGKLDYILAKSISRFSRNVLDTLMIVRKLKALDIGIYFEKENIDTLDSKNEVFLSLISIISQEESRSISTNMKWSLQKRYQRGKPMIPTKYFLGYTNDKDGNIIIDEKQAKIVKRIFKEYLDGYSTPTIAKNLMRDG
ncbi:MAG: recombinase family protein, partial [Bacillota bacterium]